jgi:2'-phosphotransferase
MSTSNTKQYKPRSNELSHALSWVLRHNAIKLGLSMAPDGYVQVSEILTCQHSKICGRNWTEADIYQVVESCKKQRFKLEMRPAANYTTGTKTGGSEVLCIRANQGHSIDIVDSYLLLERLTSEELIALPMVVHGTFKEAWDKRIRTQGLKRMKRNHIHFATGLPKDGGVMSGMRQTCEVYVFIDKKKCAQDNIQFFRSENGVILCSGLGDDGIIPPSHFSEVTDCTGRILFSTQDTFNT